MKQALVHHDALLSVNSHIDEFFEQSIKVASDIDSSYERLWRGLHTLIQSGGKRHRPRMLLMSYMAFGGEQVESVARIAAAHELLHFALLIHDDIIDRDYIRYGTDNIAGQYKHTYATFMTSNEEVTHYANSAAILAGDLMLSGAHQLIASSDLPGDAIATAQQLLSRGIMDVAGGELLDTEGSFVPYKKGDALKIARYKTASYSFISPLLTGAALGGSVEAMQRQSLREYATSLGVAYQLADDIIGVFGNEVETGKSTVGDIIEGKRTYLVERALETLSGVDRNMFMTIFGNHAATLVEVAQAKELLVSCGARSRTEQKIAEYADAARESLSELLLPDEYHREFLLMVDKAVTRSS